jgi:hypothetical protein
MELTPRYYLDSGFRVVAVAANPDLARKAMVRFLEQVARAARTSRGHPLSRA